MEFFHAFTHWHWLALSAMLLIAEVLLVSGGFLLWIGLSALAVSIIVWISPTLTWGMQLMLFSAIAIITSIAWWAYLRRYPIKTDDPKLNRRSEQYVGRTFTLVQPIENGRGKIRVDDTTWTVKGPDLPIGTKVKIIHAEGVILIAEKAVD
jgi:membrane protein implicated in regulation of membrane protease activity